MVDVRWCACIHGNSPNLDQHQNGFDLVFVCFCRICQNLDEQLLASPARCSLKNGLLKVSSSLQQRTHHHPPSKIGNFLKLEMWDWNNWQCFDSQGAAISCQLSAVGLLKRLLIWMILMRLAVCSSFKAFRTYQLPCWSLEMTRIGNVTGSGSSKCYRRSTTTRIALSWF